MGSFWRNNSLSIVMTLMFLGAWVGQTLTGLNVYNANQQDHQQAPISLTEYLGSSHFWEATSENWESEFLQMGLFVLLTVFLRQRGSPESKKIDEPEEVDREPQAGKGGKAARSPRDNQKSGKQGSGTGDDAQDKKSGGKQDSGGKKSEEGPPPWPVRQGGWILKVYENSLTLALFALFGLSFLAHVISGAGEYSEEQLQHGGQAVSAWEFLGSAQLWFQSLQNWQSEFLSIVSLTLLAVFLRQKGSPESKPVDAPHAETGGE
ncbi:MAG TPA: DUF6766 family protein [Chloroflexia bacterium]|nr:DUF6766 family protein [Chloroflexia bacterium]